MESYLIVGLGNPGLEYQKNRHNVGFMAIDKICQKLNILLNKVNFNGTYTSADINNARYYIAKPHTYMNKSGEFVSQIINFYKIPKSNVIVIYDDVDTALGKIRIKAKGSSGGQNGIKNIISCLATENIKRIRIGIDRPEDKNDMVKHVLSNFRSEQLNTLETALNNVWNAFDTFTSKKDFLSLMNQFNK